MRSPFIKVLLTCLFIWIAGFPAEAVDGKENVHHQHSRSYQPDRIIVTGTVIDENGIGMPGVNVLEKATTNGTVTNLEGVYSISVASSRSVL